MRRFLITGLLVTSCTVASCARNESSGEGEDATPLVSSVPSAQYVLNELDGRELIPFASAVSVHSSGVEVSPPNLLCDRPGRKCSEADLRQMKRLTELMETGAALSVASQGDAVLLTAGADEVARFDKHPYSDVE